ncbi:pyocin activator PrtN family protein [Pseudomonas viridiflava]|uniref:pyocin activator PrtN family protein n=1 Tax=Pseudomonas viridiflava TaxID=33069 RepID=UPI000F02018B|nr:pyocin activator PrtN family protein [Pseudomonas viridiflava]
MKTLLLLMAQYEGQAVIPVDRVCVDYMNLTVEKFKRKRLDGEIDIPLIRLGANTQKAALGIHIQDLADYIDRQRAKALKEQEQLRARSY